jgi:hypothetical protein
MFSESEKIDQAADWNRRHPSIRTSEELYGSTDDGEYQIFKVYSSHLKAQIKHHTDCRENQSYMTIQDAKGNLPQTLRTESGNSFAKLKSRFTQKISA